jgi:GNAT superfamily N-acetyltransferase
MARIVNTHNCYKRPAQEAREGGEGMSFALRRLTRDEMDQVAVVHRIAFDERLPWLAGLHTPAQDRIFFRDRVFAACEVWGAIDDELVGFIAFRPEWIDQLYVLPHRQGQGIGRALLGIAMEASASLQLWTFQQNSGARRFYEKRGFVAVEETDGTRNMEREPDVLYRGER